MSQAHENGPGKVLDESRPKQKLEDFKKSKEEQSKKDSAKESDEQK